ncbi:MAG: hypothetical protein ACTSQI_21655 [Candidatus Helarchaeota archaeon]
MPNRRAHDHIGQIRQKLNIRVGHDTTSQIISNLKELAESPTLSISDIDKIVTKVINDPKFRALFIKDFKSAAKNLGI